VVEARYIVTVAKSSYRPLNSIGLPYYNSALLSSWSQNFISSPIKYPPPAVIPPQILNTMKINDNLAYAALPKELRGRRNTVFLGKQKDTGRFRSEKPRNNVCDLNDFEDIFFLIYLRQARIGLS
jgi:hypothetical protein